MRRIVIWIALVMVAVTAAGATAATYNLVSSVVSCGGGTSGIPLCSVTATVGQPAIGLEVSQTNLAWMGFWSGELPTPTLVATVGAAKLLADGTYIAASNKITTTWYQDIPSYKVFYIEESDRSSGIRVKDSAEMLSPRGSAVTVVGTLGTTPDGERQIVGPVVNVSGTPSPLDPLMIADKRALGGADLGTPPLGQYGLYGAIGPNNIGLLVRVCGWINYVGYSPVLGNYAEIDNGSGMVTVCTDAWSPQPTAGLYGAFTGISSLSLDSFSHRIPVVLALYYHP